MTKTLLYRGPSGQAMFVFPANKDVTTDWADHAVPMVEVDVERYEAEVVEPGPTLWHVFNGQPTEFRQALAEAFTLDQADGPINGSTGSTILSTRPDALIAYFPLDDIEDNMADASPAGRDGAAVGTVVRQLPGLDGLAASGDGASGYFNLDLEGAGFFNNLQKTWFARFKRGTAGVQSTVAGLSTRDSNNRLSWLQLLPDGTANVLVRGSSSTPVIGEDIGDASDDAWHSVAISTVPGGICRVYFDGVLVTEAVDFDGTVSSFKEFTADALLRSAIDQFGDHHVQHMAVWDAELTPTEVADIHNGTTQDARTVAMTPEALADFVDVPTGLTLADTAPGSVVGLLVESQLEVATAIPSPGSTGATILGTKPESLLAYWPLDGLTAEDKSGNGTDGVVVGGVQLLEPGLDGLATTGDGVDGKITNKTFNIPSNPVTLFCRFKCAEVPTASGTIIGSGTTTTANLLAWASITVDGELEFFIRGRDQVDVIGQQPVGNVNDGRWHSLAMVADPTSGAACYVDGLPVIKSDSVNATLNSWTNLSAHVLARNTDTIFGNHTVQHVAMWDTALTAADVAAIHRGELTQAVAVSFGPEAEDFIRSTVQEEIDPRPGSTAKTVLSIQPEALELYWPMHEEAGGDAFQDASGNGRAAFVGTPLLEEQVVEGIDGVAQQGNALTSVGFHLEGAVPEPGTPFALFCRFKTDPTGEDYGTFAAIGGSVNNALQIYVGRGPTADTAQIQVVGNDASQSIVDAFPIRMGQWNSCVVQMTPDKRSQAFVNGVLVRDTPVATDMEGLNRYSVLAQVRASTRNYTSDIVQHVAVWRAMLTKQDVWELHVGGNPGVTEATVVNIPEWATLDTGVAFEDVDPLSIASLARADLTEVLERLDDLIDSTTLVMPEAREVALGVLFGDPDDPTVGTRRDAMPADARLGLVYGPDDEWVGELAVDVVYVPQPDITIGGECIPHRHDMSNVFQGDDYINPGPRVFAFALDFGSTSLTGSTGRMTANLDGGHTFNGTVTIIPDGTNPALGTMTIELDKSQLVTKSGVYDYDTEVVLADGQVITVLWGHLTLKQSQTPLLT